MSVNNNIVIYADSLNRTSGNSNNFIYTSEVPFTNVKGFKLESAEIPITFYNFNIANNEIAYSLNKYTTPLNNSLYIGNALNGYNITNKQINGGWQFNTSYMNSIGNIIFNFYSDIPVSLTFMNDMNLTVLCGDNNVMTFMSVSNSGYGMCKLSFEIGINNLLTLYLYGTCSITVTPTIANNGINTEISNVITTNGLVITGTSTYTNTNGILTTINNTGVVYAISLENGYYYNGYLYGQSGSSSLNTIIFGVGITITSPIYKYISTTTVNSVTITPTKNISYGNNSLFTLYNNNIYISMIDSLNVNFTSQPILNTYIVTTTNVLSSGTTFATGPNASVSIVANILYSNNINFASLPHNILINGTMTLTVAITMIGNYPSYTITVSNIGANSYAAIDLPIGSFLTPSQTERYILGSNGVFVSHNTGSYYSYNNIPYVDINGNSLNVTPTLVIINNSQNLNQNLTNTSGIPNFYSNSTPPIIMALYGYQIGTYHEYIQTPSTVVLSPSVLNYSLILSTNITPPVTSTVYSYALINVLETLQIDTYSSIIQPLKPNSYNVLTSVYGFGISNEYITKGSGLQLPISSSGSTYVDIIGMNYNSIYTPPTYPIYTYNTTGNMIISLTETTNIIPSIPMAGQWAITNNSTTGNSSIFVYNFGLFTLQNNTITLMDLVTYMVPGLYDYNTLAPILSNIMLLPSLSSVPNSLIGNNPSSLVSTGSISQIFMNISNFKIGFVLNVIPASGTTAATTTYSYVFSMQKQNSIGKTLCGKQLGFIARCLSGNTTVFMNSILMLGIRNLYINSQILSERSTNDYMPGNVIAKIPITVGNTQIQSSQFLNTSNTFLFTLPVSFKDIDFYLTNDYGNTVDLNGQNWSITITLIK